MATQSRTLVVVFVLLAALSLSGEQTPSSDRLALSVLQQSVQAMGGSVPNDSTATGQVTITAGSLIESGSIRIVTRGVDQTKELIETANARTETTYSKERASVADDNLGKEVPLERAASSQSVSFPLQILASALGRPYSAFEFVGTEKLAGEELNHVRFWQDFSSRPEWEHLGEFTMRDAWVDGSGILRRLAYIQRESGGPGSDGLRMDIAYSDYRNVGGVLYPFRVEVARNGTLWLEISITEVKLNTGLGEADFALRKGDR